MACRHVAVVAVSALLAVVQIASAKVLPEGMVVMRLKRNPEPLRSFSFSGFDPNGQMAMFSGAAEYPTMFGNNYGSPSQGTGPQWYGPPQQSLQDSYGPPASGVEQPVADPSNKHQYAGGQPQEYGGQKRPASDPKEQNNNSAEQSDPKKQQPYRGREGPSSNAEASFNAWFPIMFGVFPNGANGNGNGNGNGQSGNTASRGNGNDQGQNQGNGYGAGNGYERLSGGTTVIANSVSNGRHGVATSHAIAYGNPRSSSNK